MARRKCTLDHCESYRAVAPKKLIKLLETPDDEE